MFKYRLSGVRKKGIERKVRREDFWVEILLSSCSLVRLYVCLFLQVKVTEKKMEIFKVFFGAVRN